MNKEDHFIDTDKLGDVLLEFSKKIRDRKSVV